MAEETGVQEELEGQDVPAASGGLMKKLILAIVALVLVVLGAVAGMMFLGEEAPELDDNGEPVVEEDVSASGDGPAFYTSLAPPLVVNFKDRIGDDHVMQVSLDLMARDQGTINEVREHIPVVRSSLILLYSDFVYEDVSTVEGKQRMLDDGLETIRKVMQRRIGKPAVEEIYFTSLVIQ